MSKQTTCACNGCHYESGACFCGDMRCTCSCGACVRTRALYAGRREPGYCRPAPPPVVDPVADGLRAFIGRIQANDGRMRDGDSPWGEAGETLPDGSIRFTFKPGKS